MLIIDLGCGNAKHPDAVGVDNVPLAGVDVIHDLLDFPYPFDADVATEVYLNHVIEHFDLGDIQRILNEAYRIVKPGGLVHVRVPHVFSIAAWQDPTHKSSFTFGSADFFDIQGAKAYYKETQSIWEVTKTSARVTWFNWKRYRLRRVDAFLSRQIAGLLNGLLRWENWPGGADLFVKMLPLFFVEIRWDMRKPSAHFEKS